VALVGRDAQFTGLTEFPYLNGERGFVEAWDGVKFLRVRIESPCVHSVRGCPMHLECTKANLVEPEQDSKAVSTRREKLVSTRRQKIVSKKGDVASLEKSLGALVATSFFA
jgi:hypothetical protein